MPIKEIFKKYKLYTMLCIITLVLVAGGIILGVSLSKDTEQTANALSTNIYINADGTTATSSDYEYYLTIYYEEGSGVCRLDRVYYYSTSVPTTLVIPNSVSISGATYNITTMNNSSSTSSGVFYSVRSRITGVTLPSGLTNIGGYAFYYCTSLTSVEIPDSVTSIGNYAFRNCTGLTSITVDPNNQTYQSIDGVIYSKDGTTIVLYPAGRTGEYSIIEGTTSIGEGAFYSCTGLTSVTIGDSVTSIGNYAFYDCDGLTSVTIPNNVTSIGDYAFSRCDGLTSVTIPDSVISIGRYAINLCTSLISATIGDGVTSIGDHAFSGCYDLTSVTIGNNVTSIGNQVFGSCESLESIELPNSVTSIGENAFYGCSSLTSVTIPDSVTSIGNGVFNNCDNLTSINVSNDNLNYKDDNGVLYTKDGSAIIQYPAGKTDTTYTILHETITIVDSAFGYCSSLISIDIPDSVISIGDSAFEYCRGLTSITIPDGVTSIGEYAFSDCRGLTLIIIPNSVTSIGSNAFSYCTSLTSITIPNSVTSIGSNAFRSCSGLTSITIPNSVTSIGDSAFEYCRGLTSVTIGDSVTSIGNNAFRDCTSLTSVYFYNTITTASSSIGSFAFRNGNADVTYYLKDQTSLTNASSSTHSSKFTNRSANMELMDLDTTITVQSNNTNWGAVSDNSGEYMAGSSIVISATQAGDNDFLGWSLDGGNSIIEGTENQTSYVVNIAENATYTAVFDMLLFNVVVTTNDSTLGQIFANNVLGNSTTIQVQSGGAVSNIMALAVGGNAFVYWQIDRGDGNITTSTANPLTIDNITANTTVTAVFANSLLENFAVASIGGGEARINGYTEGDSYIHLSAFCYTGYNFIGWYYADADTPFSTDKSIDLDISNAESKLIIARFVPTNTNANDQTDSGNSGVM